MEAKADDEQKKIQHFMDIVGESAQQARQILQATEWHLDDAMELYFAGGADFGAINPPPPASRPSSSASVPPHLPAVSTIPDVLAESPLKSVGETYTRAPLPVKREVLYGDSFQYRAHLTPSQPTSKYAFGNFEGEANQRAANSGPEPSNSSSSGIGGMKDSLAALYKPPFVLMFQGTFEEAKAEAARQGKWLIVNLQSTKEFSSYTLNRDTWAHEAVKETVSMSFVFWQVYDDTEEGRKVCTYYKLITMPTTLVLDSLTGLKMRSWAGMISPDSLLEDLVPYLDRGPMERQPHHIPPQPRPREAVSRAVAVFKQREKTDTNEREELNRTFKACSLEGVSPSVSETKYSNQDSTEETVAVVEEAQELPEPAPTKRREFPALPEEPAAGTPSCRVAVRFPDGRRAQRRFLQSDPIQYLWSFSRSHMPGSAEGRAFKLTPSIPGATPLYFDSTATIHEAGIGNLMLAMAWD